MPPEFNGTPAIPVATSDWMDAPIVLPESAQEFAIGDVHGHAAHLAALLDTMDGEAGPGSHLTLLGDLVDRGPASLACLRLAADAAATPAIGGRTLLLGNHEMLMLMALSATPDASGVAELWVSNGGWTTLGEAGLSASRLASRPDEAASRFRDVVGPEAMALVETAPLARCRGNVVFVHAGIDPQASIADALARPRLDASDPLHPAWIRERFLHHEDPFAGGSIVVHGHTPEVQVLDTKGRRPVPGWHRLDGWRLGLDGGSYGTGIVAGAELRQGRYRVFTALGR